MALTNEQLQTMLDELDLAAASPELEVTTGDGKKVRYDSLEAIQRRRAHISALMGGRSRNRLSYVKLRDGGS